MAGNHAGGLKAAQSNKERYGDDFYIRIGQKGGKLGRTGGFYADRELASRAGRKGGRRSRRGPARPAPEEFENDWTANYIKDDSAIIEPVPTKKWWQRW